MLIDFDEKFTDSTIARTLFQSLLLLPARSYGPAWLSGTLEHSHS